MTNHSREPYEGACETMWPLLHPTEDDVADGRTAHYCFRTAGHVGRHICDCGAHLGAL